MDPRATDFTRELVDGVDGQREELDALIERHAEGWTLDRIAPLERSILRVALYELLHREDVPPRWRSTRRSRPRRSCARPTRPGS